MRCLAVCQDELVIRMLDEILLPGFEVEFIVENGPVARRLREAGVTVTAGDPRRTDTWPHTSAMRASTVSRLGPAEQAYNPTPTGFQSLRLCRGFNGGSP